MEPEIIDTRIRVAIALMYFGYGGAERMVALLASHLDLKMFNVQVYCIYGDPQDNVMEQMVIDHGVPIIYIHKGLGFSATSLADTWRALNDFKPHVIHTHLGAAMYCAPWAMAHGIRILHTIHNVPEKEFGNIKRVIMSAMYRMGKAIPVALSEKNKELVSSYYKLDEERVEMVLNPVDIDSFVSSQPLPWAKRTYDFICVARFQPQKNHYELINAFADLIVNRGYSDLKLALVGEGELRESMENLVDNLHIAENVSFLGSRDDIAELMQDSRCFVLSSTYEGLPLTILEAMASGLPVVANAVGGVPDLVIDGITGILVKPGKQSNFADAMEAIVSNESLQDIMSNNASELIKPFGIDTVTKRYSELYQKYRKE